MVYLSSKEIAKKWGIDSSFVLRLAREGRIEGSKLLGNKWMFPSDAKRPLDGRTKRAKEKKQNGKFFRFPLYVNFEEKDYTPSLSYEERLLRKAQIDFQACNFKEAKKLFVKLQRSNNRYIRLSALYHSLYISMYTNGASFDETLWKMNIEFLEDFPYKKEMLMLRYGFNTDLGFYRLTIEEFEVDPAYSYHPSSFATMILVSLVPIQNGNFSLMSTLRFDTYDLLCQQMEREGYYLEAQKLHFLLLVVYQLKNNEGKMECHIRKGLEIAFEHDLYFVPAFYFRWYKAPIEKILMEFPEDFAKTIERLGSLIHKKYSKFISERNISSYLSILSSKEFEYAFLANQGYTNREIAQIKGISEKTVSRIYSEIYDKLNVKTKQELVNLINETHRNGSAYNSVY